MEKSWTWNDYDMLRKLYPEYGIDTNSHIGKGGAKNIISRANKLGVTFDVPFTDEEVKLAKDYGSALNKALMFFMPNRTPYEVEALLKCIK